MKCGPYTWPDLMALLRADFCWPMRDPSGIDGIRLVPIVGMPRRNKQRKE